MDHLFHPWHWTPLLAALPALGVVFTYLKYNITHIRSSDADEKKRPP